MFDYILGEKEVKEIKKNNNQSKDIDEKIRSLIKMYEDLLGPVPTKENPWKEVDLPAEQTIIVNDECDCGDECDGSGKCHNSNSTPEDPWGDSQDSGCDDNDGCDGCAGC